MTDIYRVTAVWSGFTGSPGYSRFSFQGLTDTATLNSAGAAIKTFFDGLVSYFQSSWTIAVQGPVQIYDMAGGHLTGEVTMTTIPAPTVGTALTSAVWVNGAGAAISWKTNLIYAGHRVRGRTYIVPMVGQGQSDGTLLPAAITALQTSANTLISGQGGKLSVWSKQFNTATPPVQIGGNVASVTTATVADKTAVLKTRRD